MLARRRIFRPQALEQYARSREKDILPRSVAPPVFIFFWVLLGLLLVAIVLAWQVQVPVYAAASGFVAQNGQTGALPGSENTVVLFVPTNPSPALHIGQAVTLQITLTGETFPGTIMTVGPGIITPDQARQQYALTGDLALVITQPSVAVTLSLGPAFPQDVLVGSTFTTQVQIGTRPVISLLPDLLKGLLGG
jgi:hypothetical protein